MSGADQPHVGHLRILDPTIEAIPGPDGFTSTVPSNPSPEADLRAYGQRGDAVVVWSAERGWICSVHTDLPCVHTIDLPNPGIGA